MLQVVDEVDDAFGAVQHHWLGLRLEVGTLPVRITLSSGGTLSAGGILAAAIGAALVMGIGVAS